MHRHREVGIINLKKCILWKETEKEFTALFKLSFQSVIH